MRDSGEAHALPMSYEVLTDNFVDLASNDSLQVGIPVALALFGSVAETKPLIDSNL